MGTHAMLSLPFATLRPPFSLPFSHFVSFYLKPEASRPMRESPTRLPMERARSLDSEDSQSEVEDASDEATQSLLPDEIAFEEERKLEEHQAEDVSHEAEQSSRRSRFGFGSLLSSVRDNFRRPTVATYLVKNRLTCLRFSCLLKSTTFLS